MRCAVSAFFIMRFQYATSVGESSKKLLLRCKAIAAKFCCERNLSRQPICAHHRITIPCQNALTVSAHFLLCDFGTQPRLALSEANSCSRAMRTPKNSVVNGIYFDNRFAHIIEITFPCQNALIVSTQFLYFLQF